MWKYCLQVAYCGKDFSGWQRQPHRPSVQQCVEEALARMNGGVKISVIASGRTDSGVHALGQIVHCVFTQKHWDPPLLLQGLNGILPASIRICAVSEVKGAFHAQRSAVKKQYSYYFQQGPCALPHISQGSWWIRRPLDVVAMQESLRALVGEHDFHVFQASGASVKKSTQRHIFQAELTQEGIPFRDELSSVFYLLRLRLVGSGFLKQMVRGIAGTLVQVGQRYRKVETFSELLQTQERSQVGPTAPARALWLDRVWY